jgi:type IV pilus assembly protein PilE
MRRDSTACAKSRGFTLLELMIVVAIAAILASLATASYMESVVRSRRQAAASCIFETAQLMERHYVMHMSYSSASTFPACVGDLSDHYEIGFASPPTSLRYDIVAEPIGKQAEYDSDCGALHLNQAGTRSVTGVTSVPARCW